MKKIICKYKTIRGWPGCYEDCDLADTPVCIHYLQNPACVEVPESQPAQDVELRELIELVIVQNAPVGGPVNPLYWRKVTKKLFSILTEHGIGDTKQAQQEGIMKVVKFLSSKQRHNADGSVFWVCFPEKEWQSFLRANLSPEQLKEWGVK